MTRLTEYEFDQVVAEAMHRIGRPQVEAYMMRAADLFGWPIPEEDRIAVGHGIYLLLKSVEVGRAQTQGTDNA
jgi:hypothetical protein